jgi:hypothetical protein
MANSYSRSLPVPWDTLVEGPDQDRAAWLTQAVAFLTPDALLEIERRAYALIDLRYPDNPASLFNWRHLQGQWRKVRVRAALDQAFDRFSAQELGYVATVRSMLLNHHLMMLANTLYGQRRDATLHDRANLEIHFRASLTEPDIPVNTHVPLDRDPALIRPAAEHLVGLLDPVRVRTVEEVGLEPVDVLKPDALLMRHIDYFGNCRPDHLLRLRHHDDLVDGHVDAGDAEAKRGVAELAPEIPVEVVGEHNGGHR